MTDTEYKIAINGVLIDSRMLVLMITKMYNLGFDFDKNSARDLLECVIAFYEEEVKNYD